MMEFKDVINFTSDYSKLKKDAWHTVRYPDAVYPVGGEVEAFRITKQGIFHRKKFLGRFLIRKVEAVRLYELTEEFIQRDADVSRDRFMEMMRGWYSKKPQWNDDRTLVVVVYCEKIAQGDKTEQTSFDTTAFSEKVKSP